MRKKLLLTAAVALLVVIAIPVAMATLKPIQIVHVSETYTQTTPISTPTPITQTLVTPTPITPTTPAPSPETSTTKFSLWYPNGSTFNLHQENTPSVFGATNLDINGVPVNVQRGLGAPPMGYSSGVIVIRNDGNVPISVNASLANVTVSAGIALTSTCSFINPATWGSQVDGWMGRDKLATGNVVGVGEYAWLAVQVTMTNSTGNMGAIHSHDSIPYSFDVAVSASQA